MNLKFNLWKMAAVGIVLSGTRPTQATDLFGTNSFQRPAWLTEASLGVKESYDDNVFLSGVDAPPHYQVPAGGVAALKGLSSWITTVSPKVDVNFAPLLGDQKNLSVLSLAYAPEFVTFHDQDSESYQAQRFAAALKARTDSVTISADDSFLFVDGKDIAPVYPGSLYSAFATSVARERREQIQDRANFALQINSGRWFLRPVATLLYYDLLTEKLDRPGYQNYADRYDVNGGGDAGCKITPQTAVTVGWRYGHQQQEQFAFSPYSSPNDYQRVLLGLEGSPWQWLEVKIQGGPDFRDYAGDSATHITPVNDRHPVKFYGEALLLAKFTAADTLTFKYKQWQWLSGSGKVPYFVSSYDLSYHRKLTSKLGFDLGGSILSWDYTVGNLSACQRKDVQYTATVGLGYAVNSHLCLNASCALDWGRNDQETIAHPRDREFNHQLFSLAALCKF